IPWWIEPMGEQHSSEGCGVLLPELGLDLAPMLGKIAWADSTEVGALSPEVNFQPFPVVDEIEEGEVLVVPAPASHPGMSGPIL
ncbi:hypothetical protein Dimus_023106, partial [Dionaea muscipula]